MITKKTSKAKRSPSDNLLIALLLVFNLTILGFLLIANVRLFSQTGESKDKYLDLNQEIRELEKKNGELEELLAITNDEVEVEKFLREKGLYKKPGEEVVVIKREEGEQEVNIVPQYSASLLDKITDFFKNILGRD